MANPGSCHKQVCFVTLDDTVYILVNELGKNVWCNSVLRWALKVSVGSARWYPNRTSQYSTYSVQGDL